MTILGRHWSLPGDQVYEREFGSRRLTDTAASTERATIEMVQHARPGRHAVDLVGRAFGRLTVITRVPELSIEARLGIT